MSYSHTSLAELLPAKTAWIGIPVRSYDGPDAKAIRNVIQEVPVLLAKEGDAVIFFESSDTHAQISESLYKVIEDKKLTLLKGSGIKESVLAASKSGYRHLCPTWPRPDILQQAEKQGLSIVGCSIDNYERYNRKSFARNLFSKYQLSVPKGGIVENIQSIESVTEDLRNQGLNGNSQVMLKPNSGSGGANNYKTTVAEFEANPEALCGKLNGEPVLIEEFINFKDSFSFVFFLSAGSHPKLLACSKQHLKPNGLGGYSYSGSRFYKQGSHLMGEIPEKLYDLLYGLEKEGVEGCVGVDTVNTPDKGLKFIEINVRLNASVYYSSLSRFLSGFEDYYDIRFFSFSHHEKLQLTEISKRISIEDFNKKKKPERIRILTFSGLNIPMDKSGYTSAGVTLTM